MMNGPTKYAVIYMQGREKFEDRTIFPGLWDTQMLF